MQIVLMEVHQKIILSSVHRTKNFTALMLPQLIADLYHAKKMTNLMRFLNHWYQHNHPHKDENCSWVTFFFFEMI